MAYKKPLCECGEELYYVELVTDEIEYDITKAGKITKRKNGGTTNPVVTGEKLKCFECGQFYSYKEDGKGRIYRMD